LKFDNNKWDLLSYWNTLGGFSAIPFDRNHFYTRTLNGNVRFTTDGGASFEMGSFIGDTITTPIFDENGIPTSDSTRVPQQNKINSTSVLGNGEIFLAFDNAVNRNGAGAYSNDHGKTLEFINDNRLVNSNFIHDIDSLIYFYKKRIYNGQPRRDIDFYKMNKNSFEIELINTIDSADFIRVFPFFDDKLFLSVRKGSNHNENGEWVEFYEASTDFKELKSVHKVKESTFNSVTNHIKYDDKLFYKYYTINSTSEEPIFASKIFNLNSYSVQEYEGTFLDTAFNVPNNVFTENDTINKIEIKIESINGVEFPVIQRSILTKAKFNENINDFEYEFLDTLEYKNNRLMKSGSNDLTFFEGAGFWMPIEKNQNATSVKIENGVPPSIWALNAYPNPVSDKVKIAFYSAKMNIINNLKIEVINISTGISNYISNFEISILDGYNGTAEFDLSAYPPGAYLINLTLDGKSMSESIIKN
jgi:hypothetical protein